MPVELPGLEPVNEMPSPPRTQLWFSFLLLLLVVGAIYTLATAPSDPRQRDFWFWFQLLVVPTVIWTTTYGLRRHFYDTRVCLHEGEVAGRAEDYADALSFGRDPLVVLGWYYCSAMGEGETDRSGDTPERIVARETALDLHMPFEDQPMRRYTQIDLLHPAPEEDEEEETGEVATLDRQPDYRMAFMAVLTALHERFQTLPEWEPFNVRLALPEEADPARCLELWREVWAMFNLPEGEVKRIPAVRGMMVLDQWLDISEGPGLECFSLFVAVQGHAEPEDGSAEGVVALLLGWDPLARRLDLTPLARIHRPVETEGDGIEKAAEKAVLWGNVQAGDVRHLWDAGLAGSQQAALLKWGEEQALGVSGSENLNGLYNIVPAIGDMGIAGDWFALALAIENVISTEQPQMIVSNPAAPRLCVVCTG